MEFKLVMNDNEILEKQFEVNVLVDSLVVEVCQDIAVNLVNFGPAFKVFFCYDDLCVKPPGFDLEKRIKYQATFYYILQAIRAENNFKGPGLPDHVWDQIIINEHLKREQEKEENLTDEEKINRQLRAQVLERQN